MGISGLFPMLKEISEDIHIKSFAGQVAAIDAYCWIHRAAIFCAEELILGIETSRCVELSLIFPWETRDQPQPGSPLSRFLGREEERPWERGWLHCRNK